MTSISLGEQSPLCHLTSCLVTCCCTHIQATVNSLELHLHKLRLDPCFACLLLPPAHSPVSLILHMAPCHPAALCPTSRPAPWVAKGPPAFSTFHGWVSNTLLKVSISKTKLPSAPSLPHSLSLLHLRQHSSILLAVAEASHRADILDSSPSLHPQWIISSSYGSHLQSRSRISTSYSLYSCPLGQGSLGSHWDYSYNITVFALAFFNVIS